MISFLGHSTILLALIVAVMGMVLSSLGGFASRSELVRWGKVATFAVLALVGVAVALMEYALIRHDFSVQFVADVGSRETPLYYTVASLWGALEGSILFWSLLLSGYTCAFLLSLRGRFPEIQPYAIGILLGVSAFFLLVTAGPGDPFGEVYPMPADGGGLNPLLQNHWMMGIHPVLLYLGYVGLTVPFAIAIASMVRGVPGPETFRLIRRWTLFPWAFLSFGIIGGMWWSYAVLGWGGYWSWDPVENASLMPWLVATAFLHSLQVQERRGMLKTWTISLIVAAFLLSLLGTFLTRSGVLQSVHAFTQSGVGPVFLAFLGVVLAGSLALLFMRSRELAAPGALEGSICRESAFLINNLLLVSLTFVVLLGTLFPLVAEAIQGSRLSVGAPYFNHVNVPIGFALLFLMGIGPALPWGSSSLEDLQYRYLKPVAVGVGLILLLLLVGVRGVSALVTFGLSGFVLVVTAGRIATDVHARQHGTREGFGVAARRLLAANPRRYGGYLAHIGVLLVVIGIAASQTYQVRTTATLRPGQSTRVAGYIVTYRGFQVNPEPNRMVFAARVSARRGGEDLGVFLPSLNMYLGNQPVPTVAVREEPWGLVTGLLHGQNPMADLRQLLHGRNPFEDLYMVVQAIDSANANTHRANRAVTLQVLVNPMVGLIWMGGFLTGLGGFLALIPSRRRSPGTISIRESIRLKPEEATA